MTARITAWRTGDVRRYLWLKTVTGTDLRQHCAKSLLGEYVKVDRSAEVQQLELPDAPAWYFCGVTAPFVWRDNDHVLLLPAPGELTEIRTPGYALELEDVVAEPFSAADIPPGAALANLPRYRTCRNWQAAHHLAALGLLSTPTPTRS